MHPRVWHILTLLGVFLLISPLLFSNHQAAFAGGGGTNCGAGCICSNFQNYNGVCKGSDVCNGINDGNAISGTAFYSGGCGAKRGTSSHDYFCDNRQCSGSGGGGGGGGCPAGKHQETQGPECRKDLGGGWKESNECDPECGLIKEGDGKGKQKVCAVRTVCVDNTPTPAASPGTTPTLLASPIPSDQPLIDEFRITNFIERSDASSGIPFYFILQPQMLAGYKANIRWSVSGAEFCIASCAYVDQQGNRLPDGPGEVNDCLWRGTMSAMTGNFKVQPKTPGVVNYSLACFNGSKSASKAFNAAIKQFFWQEVRLQNVFNWFAKVYPSQQVAAVIDSIKQKIPKTSL